MTDHEELKTFLAMRNDAFRDMTLAKARAFWDAQGFPAPVADDVPLGALHKARLQWLDATDEMLAESVQWLKDHHYDGTMRGADPLTPQTRDEQRVGMGKPPLGRTQ